MLPDKYTIEEKMVNVGDGYQLYCQHWGNKNVKDAIVFLHGGPGSGCSDKHKQLFDPLIQRVVFFDQRGCGKSLPRGSLNKNDTKHMIEDINKVTAAFGLNEFTLIGGSWGSCLALAYAIEHPSKVKQMVLRGIFTGRKDEIDFIYRGNFKAFFPEVWQKFVDSVPDKYKHDPHGYHLPRALGTNADEAKKSAFAYSELENSLQSLDDRITPENYEEFDPTSTIIELHYMANNCFLPEAYILKKASSLKMPIQLIQGRYDAVCPPITAYELHQKLPNSQLFWTTAGHSGNDRANWDLVKALLAR